MVGPGRFGPKSRPRPYLGLSVFQDSDSRPAAGGAPNSGASAGAAAPCRHSAGARAQPLRFASIGSNRSPLHRPASKASSFLIFICSVLYLFLFPQRGSNSHWVCYETAGGSGCGVSAAAHRRPRGRLGDCPLHPTPRLGEGSRG